ncbi:adenylate/guanylate cyclase domain-containing protein [Phaeospirillum tilakii]|uniref:Adenylate/guanylate cyclase domain-containing protein n=1 Tax=Phaeospirillum tilakii TaxID=741673 RepID=A0ABW5CG54_9PROT
MIIVHFEVYVLEPQGWVLHARFPRADRDEALSEAYQLESTSGLRVKVLRETYNTDDNSFSEAEVYTSRRDLPPRKPGSPAPTPAARPRGRPAPPPRSRRPAEEDGHDTIASAAAVLIRLTLILLVGVGVGLLALKILPSVVLKLYEFGFRITPEGYSQLLAGVFVSVVILVTVPLGLRFLPTHALLPDRSPRRARPGAVAPQPQPEARPRPLRAPAEPTLPATPSPGLDEITIPETWDFSPEERAADALEDLPPPGEPPAPEPVLSDEPLPPPPAPPGPPAAYLAAAAACDRFLDGALAVVKDGGTGLDQYQRFALNLYMAGAVGALAESHQLDAEGRGRLLGEALRRLEAPADLAARFGERLGEYMMEPRYMRLIQAGRGGADLQELGDSVGAHATLAGILREWNRPAAEKKASIMTVMFTDMVGSTDLTQAKGDVAAQEIVRRHNAIVRSALARFSGKEIKHTGDGIMAAFGSAASAVEACVAIQTEVAAHNARQPDLALHLRIGLNAGEPIQEEDDLFGVTVQLAARVCNASAADAVLCTTVVKDLASGKGARFESAGSFALKGFRDKIPLWSVVWR